jgi:hypothetical protein
MKDVTVRQLEMTSRVIGFFQDNPIVFRKGSPGADLVAQFKSQVAELQSLTATQVSEAGQSRAYTHSRGVSRESLKAAMEEVSRTAQAIAITVPGLAARFEAMNHVPDSKLETRARALIESVKPYVKQFVDFEMEPDFIKTLESKLQAFTESVANHKASRTAHVAASQLIVETMERTLTTLEQLDPIIRNKFRGNTGLKLKWENVRHIERRWIYKKPVVAAPQPTEPVAPPVSVETPTTITPLVPAA